MNDDIIRYLSRANWDYDRSNKTETDSVKDIVGFPGDETDILVIDGNVAISTEGIAKIISQNPEAYENRTLDDCVNLALNEKFRSAKLIVKDNYVSTSSRSRDPIYILCVVLVVAVVCAILYCVYFYVKRYCDTFVSVDELKSECCTLLKEQVLASRGQADAQANSDKPSVIPEYITTEGLKQQVLSKFSEEDRSRFVVRFRMFMALRSLRKMSSVRFGLASVEKGQTAETYKWVGRIDS